jgi:hypothetical protein
MTSGVAYRHKPVHGAVTSIAVASARDCISLQGDAQARLIEHKLLETLEPEVIEQRRLICGDAYAFQGDEHMVAALGETWIGVLSNDSARQRFNVAASRAQGQLWSGRGRSPKIAQPTGRVD